MGEPTMSSAIITMGRSPTACPFGTATTCTYQVTTHFQTTWNNPGSLVTTSQGPTGRRPHGSLQAPPQCTALVEPWAGGLMVASTTARVTLVTAAAATATALHLARTLRSTIGLERFLSLSGLPAHIRRSSGM